MGRQYILQATTTKSTLKKVSLLALPGTASEVDGLPRVSHAGLWALSTGGIYFVPAEAPRSLRYFDFATRQIRPIFEVDKDFGSGLSISPDGRWIILFTSRRCEQRHHAGRSLSLSILSQAGVALEVSFSEISAAPPQFANGIQKGIRPHHMRTISRSPKLRLSQTMGWNVCGATFQLGSKSEREGPCTWECSAIFACLNVGRGRHT